MGYGWDVVDGILQFGGPVGLSSGTYLAPSEAFAVEPTLGFFRFASGRVGLTTTTTGGGIDLFSTAVDNGQSASPAKNRFGYILSNDWASPGGLAISGFAGATVGNSPLSLTGFGRDGSTFPYVQISAAKYTSPNGLGTITGTEHVFIFSAIAGVTAVGNVYWDMLGTGQVTHSVYTSAFGPLGTTSAPGYGLQSGVVASVGQPTVISPYFNWRSYAWDGSASQTVDFFAEVLPVSQASPIGTWRLKYSLNGAAATIPFLITSVGNTSLLGKITSYNGSGTAGAGIAVISGNSRVAGATAAVSNQGNVTVGAADGTYEVNANILVTTATTHTFTATCNYTDESNTARVVTLTFGLIAGGVATTSITNTNGAVPYLGVPLLIRAKAGSTITINTTGTFTTVVYNIEALIKLIA